MSDVSSRSRRRRRRAERGREEGWAESTYVLREGDEGRFVELGEEDGGGGSGSRGKSGEREGLYKWSKSEKSRARGSTETSTFYPQIYCQHLIRLPGLSKACFSLSLFRPATKSTIYSSLVDSQNRLDSSWRRVRLLPPRIARSARAVVKGSGDAR